MTEHDETTSVELPTSLVKRVERRLSHTEFDAVDAYVTYVLEEVLFHVEDAIPSDAAETVDEDQIRSQLRALGYVDE